jgi:galactose-1-phosphate uridylyltransferase
MDNKTTIQDILQIIEDVHAKYEKELPNEKVWSSNCHTRGMLCACDIIKKRILTYSPKYKEER